MIQGSLSEPERLTKLVPPNYNLRYSENEFSELLKIQKFGHLLIGILSIFFDSIFVHSCNF